LLYTFQKILFPKNHFSNAGRQKLRESAEGLRRKVWTQTKIWSPNICYFVAVLRFVTICAVFWKTLGKKVLFGVKTVFLAQEVHHYMGYIAYYTGQNLQICNYTQKQRIFRENSEYAPDENFRAIFALAERLPTSATLVSWAKSTGLIDPLLYFKLSEILSQPSAMYSE